MMHPLMCRLGIVLCVVCALWVRSRAQLDKTDFPAGITVSVLLSADSVVFAGTNGRGIFVTRDHGEHWTPVNEGLESTFIHAICCNGSTVFAGTEAGVSMSTNNGASWTSQNAGLNGKGVWSIAARNNSADDSVIYAGTWNGLYISSNHGRTWDTTRLSATTMPVCSIVAYKNYLYVATFAGGTYVSLTNGTTWKEIGVIEPEQKGNNGIVATYSLARVDTLVVAGTADGNLFYTSYRDPRFMRRDGGAQSITGHILLCLASRTGELFAGDWIGRVYVLRWNGSRWLSDVLQMGTDAVTAVAVDTAYVYAAVGSSLVRFHYPQSSAHQNQNEAKSELPTACVLDQNFPNPFNPSTTIRFTLPNAQQVRVSVYDILGNEVAELVNGVTDAGTHAVRFDPHGIPSGLYVCRLRAGTYSEIRKMLYVK
ncbi:MAG TPA: T9SS type A sorting domain-containing protein [Bacteroidota bacterium]|nr:T9SS type A sorting domain-containing protein [Bacteroidota bacterium]